MKNIFVLIVLIFISDILVGQSNNGLTTRDSLLQVYSEEEIKEMNPYEVYNAVQKMRGLPLIEVPKEKESPTHDQWGISIVRNIDEESAIKKIEERFQIIEKEKHRYKQSIFPNGYTDVFDGFFGGMYDDLVERTLVQEDFLNYSYDDSWGGMDVNTFSNNTRRTYYFNKESKLRLITVEYGYNINEGPKNEYYEELQPLYYRKHSYYIWDDTLQFVYSVEGTQIMEKILPDEVPTEKELATSPVYSKASSRYFYKNNCFKQLIKESLFPKKSWQEDLLAIENTQAINCYNKDVIVVRNYIIEYDEKNQNNYLKPVESSYIQPYIIDPINND